MHLIAMIIALCVAQSLSGKVAENCVRTTGLQTTKFENLKPELKNRLRQRFRNKFEGEDLVISYQLLSRVNSRENRAVYFHSGILSVKNDTAPTYIKRFANGERMGDFEEISALNFIFNFYTCQHYEKKE